tara:strand:- start:683 stop:2059 length:1377 start_codon:yes stop_codon:yes gene_type:complete
MGFFSKIWKGVKKVVKKVVKPIAKIFKPITKFFNKFGVIGQIGMMFLMPYAFGALSSFMGGALNAVGSWSQTLMKSANWGAKALGHGLDLIHKAGTMVKNVYTSVTGTIKNAVDRTGNFLKGRGFVKTTNMQLNLPEAGNLSVPEDLSKSLAEGVDYQEAVNKSFTEAASFNPPSLNEAGGVLEPKSLMDATSISNTAIDSSALKMPDFAPADKVSLNLKGLDKNFVADKYDFKTGTYSTDNLIEGFGDAGTNTIDNARREAAKRAGIDLTADLPSFDSYIPPELGTAQTTNITNLMGMPSEANYFTGITPSKTKGIVEWSKNQLSNLNPFNPDGSLRKKAANFDAGEFVVDSANAVVQGGIVSGAQTAVAQDVAEMLGYKQPEGATYYEMDIPNLITMASNDYTVYDSVNLMQSQTGNSWMASNYANANSISNFVDSSSSYNSYMGQFGRSMYDSTV